MSSPETSFVTRLDPVGHMNPRSRGGAGRRAYGSDNNDNGTEKQSPSFLDNYSVSGTRLSSAPQSLILVPQRQCQSHSDTSDLGTETLICPRSHSQEVP